MHQLHVHLSHQALQACGEVQHQQRTQQSTASSRGGQHAVGALDCPTSNVLSIRVSVEPEFAAANAASHGGLPVAREGV